MLLDEMNQVAYPLIKHQHELVQHFTTVKSRYEQETQDNLTRFLQEKEDNEQKMDKGAGGYSACFRANHSCGNQCLFTQ